MIMIVGEGMRQRIGVTAESTMALAKEKINLEMINQGSSEVSIMFGIKKNKRKKPSKLYIGRSSMIMKRRMSFLIRLFHWFLIFNWR